MSTRRRRIRKILSKSLKHVGGSIGSAPSRLKHKVKGYLSDNKRGTSLWGQGYGKYYDSAQKIAKAGKSGRKGRRRVINSAF